MRILESLRSMLIQSNRAFIWSATAMGLIVLLSFFAAIGYDFYRGTMLMSEQSATNIAGLTEQDIARNLELYDLSLRAVLDGATDPQVMSLDPTLRRRTLFDRSATAQGLGALVALDRDGTIFLDSQSSVPRAGNFADREYFIVHRDSKDDIGLYLSRPFRARLQGNIWSISASRRIPMPDGRFAGIVSGTIKLEYFQRLFNKVTLGPDDSISLLRTDGTLIVRNVADDDQVGHDWKTEPVFSHLGNNTRGSFIGDGSVDGVTRLYAFHRVGDLPLVVVVGLSKSHILAPWRFKISILVAIFLIMSSTVLALVWLLEKELQRRAIAESNADAMAMTDGLTKLANRRAFDEGLSREWARASRDGLPMSLVLIDVDYFKLFNDTYGHQIGDEALIALGSVIARCGQRPGDLAARYGGEEFVVLLPNTDVYGAQHVATSIRDQVGSLRIAHRASQHKIVTISIGIATAKPSAGTLQSSLVRDADVALYRAKDQGRNTICTGNVVPGGFNRQLDRAV